LTVAVLVFFLVLVLSLATLLRLVLAGLTALFLLSGLATLLAVLSGLTGLTTLLTLSELAALLTLLLHIVCHKSFLLRKRGPSHAFEIYRRTELSCAGDRKGWEGFLPRENKAAGAGFTANQHLLDGGVCQ
jgi:hypothetical protein